MNYLKTENQIKVFALNSFDIEHILLCGQIFTFEKKDNSYLVFSRDKMCKVDSFSDHYIIETKDTDYFENFFDLKTDYQSIKDKLLKKDKSLKKIIEFGKGIRILKQDLLEVIVCFIISANNNIPRIKKSIKYIRENAGEFNNGYFAFPSFEKLLGLDEEFFIKAGLGYRAKQIVKTFSQLKDENFYQWHLLDTARLNKKLISLSGVGQKVADCILLFAFARTDVFPIDTWIEQFYKDLLKKLKNKHNLRGFLLEQYNGLAGYAQQYIFFYKKSIKI